MPVDRPNLVIVGDGEFAEIAYEYFSHDSPYRVAAFAVERPFFTKDRHCGRPVVPFDELEARYPPSAFSAFVAVTYTQLNRVRARLFHAIKAKGYRPASYVSSRAFRWPNSVVGENCFIFEQVSLQHHVRVGDDVVVWAGSILCHRSTIGDHAFLSANVGVAGYAEIGESCFVGINAAIGDRVKIARDCIIGAGAVVTRDTEPGRVYKGNRQGPAAVGSLNLFKVQEAA